MKSAKTSEDDSESRDSYVPRPQENQTNLSGTSPTAVSGSALAGASEQDDYLTRKAASANGQWGRVKEMPNGCWEWQGQVNAGGYGKLMVDRRKWMATKLLLRIFTGKIPKGAIACHSCDNPRCCNPKHLFLGTYSDNLNDCRAKKRRPNAHKRVLNYKLAAEIRRDFSQTGGSHRAIAEKYGIHIKTMGALLSGATWNGAWRWRKCPLSREQRDATRTLYAQGGWSVRTLAEHMGAKPRVIRRCIEQAELSEEEVHGR